MLYQAIRDIAVKIGQFYLQKHNGDYEAAEKELVNTRITKIDIVVNTVHITAAHVGLLIGKRGQNIDNLSKFLETEVKIYEDTDNLYDYLIPHKEYDNYPQN